MKKKKEAEGCSRRNTWVVAVISFGKNRAEWPF